jgi:hypothetical protein
MASSEMAFPHPDCPQCRADIMQSASLPGFAQIPQTRLKPISSELQGMEHKALLTLVREHIFLYFHWFLFLAISAVGIMLAIKCYVEFSGDFVTRLIMAFTPALFINTTACCCLICVNGTKKKIKRLNEELHHIRLQIEYEYVL